MTWKIELMEITQSGHQTENQMKKHESNIRDIWDNIKQANLCIIGIPEREEKEKGIENIFEEIMSENFPNLKKTDTKIQEAQRAPNKLNPNRPIPRHIIIKMTKVKESILGCKFFPFRTLNMSCHSLLACSVSAEKSADSLMGAPL